MGERTPLLHGGSRGSLQGTAGVSELQLTQLRIEDISVKANVRNSSFARVNHYIRQSRCFFPSHKLEILLDFPWMECFALVSLCLSAIGGLALLDLKPYFAYFPVVGFLLSAVWIAVFGQHVIVCNHTLPLVLRQPVLPGQKFANAFYKLTITEVDSLLAGTPHEGIGFIRIEGGQIEFQAFNQEAIKRIQKVRRASKTYLLLFILLAIYNFYFTMASSLGLAVWWKGKI